MDNVFILILKALLTNFPVCSADTIMLESSPPLMINELFVEHATHMTAAICSLQVTHSYRNALLESLLHDKLLLLLLVIEQGNYAE